MAIRETVSVYIALGSNLGDSRALINEALKLLKDSFSDLTSSSLYETDPVACAGPSFINAVAHFTTSNPLPEVIATLETVEKSLGKRPKPKDEPRLIDLDLLFYGSKKYSCLGYTVPHPSWENRLFVLEPLLELVKYLDFEGETIDIEGLCNQLR